jgi:hypothetical protein
MREIHSWKALIEYEAEVYGTGQDWVFRGHASSLHRMKQRHDNSLEKVRRLSRTTLSCVEPREENSRNETGRAKGTLFEGRGRGRWLAGHRNPTQVLPAAR